MRNVRLAVPVNLARFASSSHIIISPGDCDHPKNTQQITRQRYGKRLVESKEIKINLIYFQLLKIFMIYSNKGSFVSGCFLVEWDSLSEATRGCRRYLHGKLGVAQKY